jgi:predicted small lipoprotein YifL
MYSKKLGNLTQHTRNTAGLVALFATLFLSACGIKGDLYQTPVEEAVETNPQEQLFLEPNITPEPAERLIGENPSVPSQE